MAAEETKPLISEISSSSSSGLFTSYIGISFAVFLGFLPKASIAYISSLQSRNRILSMKLFHVEDQLKSILSRRKEDAKANARVVEIFAGHRNAWQSEERLLLQRIEDDDEEIGRLRARIAELERSEKELGVRVETLEREVEERQEMIEFMGRREEEEEEDCGVRVRVPVPVLEELDRGMEAYFLEEDDIAAVYAAAAAADQKDVFGREFSAMERSTAWQDMQYDSHESMHHVKNFMARRESPWKVDGDSTGISSKLKSIEQELLNLENAVKGDFSKVPSLVKKQAKRYQSLTGKIDELCRRMQVSNPREPTLSPEFWTQRQTDFLVEASRLQHRAAETRQKLSSLQAEAAKSYTGSELPAHTIINMKRSADSVSKNFRDIQRNLEIWLARIIGDVEGTLARDAVSTVRDYYVSRYPFVQ